MDLSHRGAKGFFAPFVLLFSLLLVLSAPSALAQAQSAPTATLKVTKSIPSVSLDDVATFRLVVENNGTVPVFDIEVYEYINTALQPAGSILITTPEGQTTQPLSTGGVATASQVIVDPPPPASLLPGQSLSLEYKMHAPHSGDYQVPASLAWFSYLRDRSTIRSNYYSNGLMLHVANGYEKAILAVYPYVLSGTTFAATTTVLLWARERLKKSKRRLLVPRS